MCCMIPITIHVSSTNTQSGILSSVSSTTTFKSEKEDTEENLLYSRVNTQPGVQMCTKPKYRKCICKGPCKKFVTPKIGFLDPPSPIVIFWFDPLPPISLTKKWKTLTVKINEPIILYLCPSGYNLWCFDKTRKCQRMHEYEFCAQNMWNLTVLKHLSQKHFWGCDVTFLT